MGSILGRARDRRRSKQPSGRLYEVYKWLGQASIEDIDALLAFAAALFGAAEGKVFEKETEASCNHWWHRDLADPAVEADLLRDPEFYRTCMKTDRRVKRER